MTRIVIRTDDAAGFFSRAKDAARKADQGAAFEGKLTLSFEDPQQMFTVLSEARRRLMLEVCTSPGRLMSCLTACIATVRLSPKMSGCLRRWGCLSRNASPIRGMGFKNWCVLSRLKSRWWQHWGNFTCITELVVSQHEMSPS